MMIPKEDVIVVVSNDGYIKRYQIEVIQASKEEDTGLKENDYVIGIYEMNTTDSIIIY